MTITDFFMLDLLIISILCHLYSLFWLRRISRKLNYWRKKAVSSNGSIQKMKYLKKKSVLTNITKRPKIKETEDELDGYSEESGIS